MRLGDLQFSKKPITFEETSEVSELILPALKNGLNNLDNFIIWNDNGYLKVYDRVCDHGGGKLISKNNVVTCPLHGWKLDPSTGKYANVECTKTPVFQGALPATNCIKVVAKKLSRKLENFHNSLNFRIRFLNHACFILETENFKIATDPWIVGSAFCNGWWLSQPSPADSITQLNSCDCIYISHNHPDHLNIKTLSKLDKNIPILTPKFSSGSCVSLLNDLGFKDIREISFDHKWLCETGQVSFSVLKSGDFRDDSGLLIEIGDRTVLFTVDCNFIDFWRFPKKIDVLASSFAGGASGFPLCFNNYNENEKTLQIERNKRSIYTSNKMVLQKVRPQYFIPYAGFFEERALRDEYIMQHNKKNSIQDYKPLCDLIGSQLVDVTNTPIVNFAGDKVSCEEFSGDTLSKENTEIEIARERASYSPNFKLIKNYFENSHFHKNLDCYIVLTNDSFEPVDVDSKICVEFSEDKAPRCFTNQDYPRRDGINYLEIKVREIEFFKVIQNGLPWEDLSIGFQLRVWRDPNVYNSEFWYHFTNIYISQNRVSRQQACSTCDMIEQSLSVLN